MKPFLKIVDTHQNSSFQVVNVNEPCFFPAWHFHPEFEIMYVLEGTGIRFVGDSIERFQAGDLVLLGSNLPHLYRSDETFYSKDSPQMSRAIVIYFKGDFAGEHLWSIPEMAPVKKLLQSSLKGLKFDGITRMILSKYIHLLLTRGDGLDRVIDLLTILKYMAISTDVTTLSGQSSLPDMQANDGARINNVYQFILDNYSTNPSLEEVAKVACMSATAFCRYFKKHTNKTYVQFLNEVKIGNATKLLIDNKMTISQICFEAGFNNFNHFNNIFKRVTGYTPGQYQHQHVESSRKVV